MKWKTIRIILECAALGIFTGLVFVGAAFLLFVLVFCGAHSVNGG